MPEHLAAHETAGKAVAALLAEFRTPEAILEAAEKVRDAGYRAWDVHTPFPVHGMDGAMGIKRTILPWIILAGGAAGCLTGFLLQWFTNAFDYPIRVSGKPFLSLSAYFPIMFELTVLFSAITAFVGVMVLNRLPEYHHALFSSERFMRMTDDRFFLAIDARDARFDLEATRSLLESLGAAAVEAVED